jgi:hypothetical protein
MVVLTVRRLVYGSVANPRQPGSDLPPRDDIRLFHGASLFRIADETS